jgi:hypothetical protein
MIMKTLSVTAAILMTLAATALAAPKVRWVAYKSNLLNLQISVPADWKPSKIPKALAFHYDDLAGGVAAIGVLKSQQITSVEEAADKEMQTEGHPADWMRTNASVSGMKAIKIAGSDAKDATKRMVHYYVETPNGVYIVQCLGTADHWSIFSPIFSTILTKLKFL